MSTAGARAVKSKGNAKMQKKGTLQKLGHVREKLLELVLDLEERNDPLGDEEQKVFEQLQDGYLNACERIAHLELFEKVHEITEYVKAREAHFKEFKIQCVRNHLDVDLSFIKVVVQIDPQHVKLDEQSEKKYVLECKSRAQKAILGLFCNEDEEQKEHILDTEVDLKEPQKGLSIWMGASVFSKYEAYVVQKVGLQKNQRVGQPSKRL